MTCEDIKFSLESSPGISLVFISNKHVYSLTYQDQRVPFATRGLIIVEMKADDELAISLPVHFKSVKKRKYVLRKKKQNKTKQKKEVPSVGVEPRTTCKVNVLSIAPRQLQLTPNNSNPR